MGRGDTAGPPIDPTIIGIVPEQDKPTSPEEAREKRKKEIFKLALELIESGETFPFPGVSKAFYNKSKIEEVDFVEMGLVTPIDDVIEKFQREGMKVVLGDDPMAINVLVIPGPNTKIDADSFLIQNLDIIRFMDPRIVKLIEVIQRKV